MPGIYRYRASIEDIRDFVYKPSNQSLPENVDLRPWDSLVEDQLYLGSCSGQAVSSAYELSTKKLYPQQFVELSELFIYYNSRVLEGTVEEDSGATLRNSFKGLKQWGVCTDELWPYDITKFTVQPTPECYRNAASRKIPQYNRVITVSDMMDALYSGYPIVVGLEIFSSFLNLDAANYIMTASGYNDGYHAMTLVGYNDNYFIVKNSYGSEWGLNGYCNMPFEYASQYVYEGWIFTLPTLQ